MEWCLTRTASLRHLWQGKGKNDRRVPLNSTAEDAPQRLNKAWPRAVYPTVFQSEAKSRSVLLTCADVAQVLRKDCDQGRIGTRAEACVLHPSRGTDSNLIIALAPAAHPKTPGDSENLYQIQIKPKPDLNSLLV
jgi:hypothetical protein